MRFNSKLNRKSGSIANPSERPVTFDCAALTDPGPRRSTNEDHFLIADLGERVRVASTSVPGLARLADDTQEVCNPVLMVADGVSGQPNGETASALTIRTVVAHLADLAGARATPEGAPPVAEVMSKALEEAGGILREMTEANPGGAPATTGTMAAVEWPSLDLVHVGDSRCYLVRSGELNQLTTDHTLAEELRAVGGAPAPALTHILTRAIGGECQVSDRRRLQLLRGDTLLVCSDGLSDTLDEDTLKEILGSRASATKRCRQLIRSAIAANTRDNVTAIVVTAA